MLVRISFFAKALNAVKKYETNPKSKFSKSQNSKPFSFAWIICILNIVICFEFGIPCFEFYRIL